MFALNIKAAFWSEALSSRSIPTLPEVSQDEDLATRAVNVSPTVKGAQELAWAKLFQARGEHKALYPAVDLVGREDR